MCLARSEDSVRWHWLTALANTALEAPTMFQSPPETSPLLLVFHEGLVPGKRRRAMAAAKQIPVSMLSGFLGSGASPALPSACSAAL